MSVDDDNILKTMQLIKNKYSVGESIALKYAKMTLEALESHGGIRTDFSSVVKVVEVVLRNWLEDDEHMMSIYSSCKFS